MADHTVGTDFQGRPVDRSISDAELESSHDDCDHEDLEILILSDGRQVAEFGEGEWCEVDARGAVLSYQPVDLAIVENDLVIVENDDVD